MLIATLSAFVVALGTAAVVLAATASPAQAQNCNGYVALTFDDGPSPSTTTNLLNALTANGLRATMFNIGRNVAANPSTTRAQVDAGMWNASHTQTHPDLTKLTTSQMAQEISSAQQSIQQVTGVR
jgi:peptidoglycan/xylan/chitin deacetylase (PgdA/CDA1 family)